jgi:hypothetical protein
MATTPKRGPGHQDPDRLGRDKASIIPSDSVRLLEMQNRYLMPRREGLHFTAEAVTGLGEDHRKRHRHGEMFGREPHHLARHLQPGHVRVQRDPVHTIDLQADMTVTDLVDVHHAGRAGPGAHEGRSCRPDKPSSPNRSRRRSPGGGSDLSRRRAHADSRSAAEVTASLGQVAVAQDRPWGRGHHSALRGGYGLGRRLRPGGRPGAGTGGGRVGAHGFALRLGQNAALPRAGQRRHRKSTVARGNPGTVQDRFERLGG